MEDGESTPAVAAADAGERSLPLFRIATFVNDRASYAAMRASFEAGGFDEPHAVYEALSDAVEEPFAAIRRLGRASEPYVLLVHQDVLCDQGHVRSDLVAALDALTRRDDRWALAGNAGGASDLRVVRHVSDPWGVSWTADLPVRVVTLDENFLVLRTSAQPQCSVELEGFHLYASDACLEARTRGHSAYVIDFRLTHLSTGTTDAGYDAAAAALAARWSARTWFAYLATPNSVVCLSRVPGVAWLLGAKRICLRLEHQRWPYRPYVRSYRGWLSP